MSEAVALLTELSEQVNRKLEEWVPPDDTPPVPIHEAMRYSLFAGGKRLRPALALLACDLFTSERARVFPVACALELLHTYSLIHDDLPAMDDDDFRRGRPSCHKRFNEAIAILAGDALLTYAFELVAAHTPEPATASRLVAALALGAGTQGMVGGQVADITTTQATMDAEKLDYIHRHKTAALLSTSTRCGAIAGGAPPEEEGRLADFGRFLGLAFQIRDDILDRQATREQLGKTVGKDERDHKLTYPALYGLEESERKACELSQQAVELLAPWGARSEPLRSLAQFVVSRTK